MGVMTPKKINASSRCETTHPIGQTAIIQAR